MKLKRNPYQFIGLPMGYLVFIGLQSLSHTGQVIELWQMYCFFGFIFLMVYFMLTFKITIFDEYFDRKLNKEIQQLISRTPFPPHNSAFDPIYEETENELVNLAELNANAELQRYVGRMSQNLSRHEAIVELVDQAHQVLDLDFQALYAEVHPNIADVVQMMRDKLPKEVQIAKPKTFKDYRQEIKLAKVFKAMERANRASRYGSALTRDLFNNGELIASQEQQRANRELLENALQNLQQAVRPQQPIPPQAPISRSYY